MKKMVLLLGILSMGFQCGPEYPPELPSNAAYWYIKNSTGQLFKTGYYSTLIASGTEDLRFSTYGEQPILFEALYKRSLEEGWLAFIDILSDDCGALAQWNYLDRYQPGKQFFNEASWQRAESHEGGRTTIKWTFEILPEDVEVRIRTVTLTIASRMVETDPDDEKNYGWSWMYLVKYEDSDSWQPFPHTIRNLVHVDGYEYVIKAEERILKYPFKYLDGYSYKFLEEISKVKKESEGLPF